MGRITEYQKNNLKSFSSYQVNSLSDCSDFIGNSEAILDIGFGDGDFTIFLADRFENHKIISSEVYKSGIGSLIGKLKSKSINSVKIFDGDIRDLIVTSDKPIFDKVFVMFPDPWQKAKHHKRRLINSFFFEVLKHHLKKDAEIFISTDWENYAEAIRELQDISTDFSFTEGKYPETSFVTRFAERATQEGRTITNFKISFLK